ncbi:DUF4060 family protein [Enterobacter sp. LM3]|uniref:DUF4060 family protein n=1 Tax=Enterobacter sp. LM3 TaxID=3384450 RepID=UPI00398750FE
MTCRGWLQGSHGVLNASNSGKAHVRLINRCKSDPLGREACALVLKRHHELFGDHGKQHLQTFYTVKIRGRKITVEIVNRPRSYVATAMIRARHLQCLPGLGR